MLALLADSSPTTYLIALLSSGGVLGALLGFFKLRGDKDTAAVTQAQGAMETMQDLNEALIKERDYWRTRFERCHAEKSELLAYKLRSDHDPREGATS